LTGDHEGTTAPLGGLTSAPSRAEAQASARSAAAASSRCNINRSSARRAAGSGPGGDRSGQR